MSRKYRIKEVYEKDRYTKYYPQYKGWFFWKDYKTYLCGGYGVSPYYELDQAVSFLDKEIRRDKCKDVNSGTRYHYVQKK